MDPWMGPSDLHSAQTLEVGQGLAKGGTMLASFPVSHQGVAGLRAGQGSKEAYYTGVGGGLWSLSP